MGPLIESHLAPTSEVGQRFIAKADRRRFNPGVRIALPPQRDVIEPADCGPLYGRVKWTRAGKYFLYRKLHFIAQWEAPFAECQKGAENK